MRSRSTAFRGACLLVAFLTTSCHTLQLSRMGLQRHSIMHCPPSTILSLTTRSTASTRLSMSSTSQNQSTVKSTKVLVQGRKKVRPVYLKHERDFFRQVARLESMDSFVLISTLTASMSFGAVLGFQPATSAAALSTIKSLFPKLAYKSLCGIIPILAGFSTIFGLYATITFSLTILYGKSALGAERDLEYEKFLKRTVRPRVHGARCFTLSLGLFALEAFFVLLERTFFKPWFMWILGGSVSTMVYLWRDWRLILKMAE